MSSRSSRNEFFVSDQGDYKKTATFQEAPSQTRKLINRYRRDQNISEQQMYLLIRQRELEGATNDQKKRAAFPGQVLVIMAAFVFMGGIGSGVTSDVAATLTTTVGFLAMVALYFLGVFDQYKCACKKVKKRLAKYPQAMPLDEWSQKEAQAKAEAKEAAKATGKAKKRRRHH